MNFITPDLSDKRIEFAAEHLEERGYQRITNAKCCDFVLLGVNPDKEKLNYSIPIFAGNVSAKGVFDYTKDEAFAIKNAFLTAEGALSLAIEKSAYSLINSKVLITGYGKIAKALHYYLTPFTGNITVCARSDTARAVAIQKGAKAFSLDVLRTKCNYDYIFNTIPHPIFNEAELSLIKSNTLLIDLASFPGGVDRHFAKSKGVNLINARGLPSLYSPKSAGITVGETVDKLIKEGKA